MPLKNYLLIAKGLLMKKNLPFW